MTLDHYERSQDGSPHQGSLYRDVEVPISFGVHGEVEAGDAEERRPVWVAEYAIVLSQECDLQQDQKERPSGTGASVTSQPKYQVLLPTVLMSPAYNAAKFRAGNHLEALGITLSPQDIDKIKKNYDCPRYHFIAGSKDLKIPDLIVDFKHYFTIETHLVRRNYSGDGHRIGRLATLYREDLSQRFASYLARIGLPRTHSEICADAKDDGSGTSV
jgi:hypothetical protein